MVVERLEVHLPQLHRRLAAKVIQSAPVEISRKQMFNDLIRARVQFKKIDEQPNYFLLKLRKQLTYSQRFEFSPKREEIRFIEQIP